MWVFCLVYFIGVFLAHSWLEKIDKDYLKKHPEENEKLDWRTKKNHESMNIIISLFSVLTLILLVAGKFSSINDND